MNRAKLRIPMVSAIVAVVLVGGVAVQRVGAQSSANPSLLAAIQDLAKVVAGLVTTTETIETTVENLATPASSNVRFTAPIFVGDSGGLLCAVSNVDNVAHQVKSEIIVGFTGAVTLTFTLNLAPGEATAGSKALTRDAYYCRFTVLDGVRGDIRGSAQAIGSNPNLITAAE